MLLPLFCGVLMMLFGGRFTVLGSFFMACSVGVVSLNLAKNVKKFKEEYPVSLFLAEVHEVKNYQNFHQYKVELRDHKEVKLIGETVLLASTKNLELISGENFYARAKLKLIPEPSVPMQFSFKEYNARRGIYLQAFLPKDIYVRSVSLEKGFSYYVSLLRSHLRKNIQKSIKDKLTVGVLSALVLGDKTSLTHQVKNDYKTAGVIHVLAVSGLHVGFYYFLIMLFLRYVRIKWLHILLLALALVFYAGLTGFSPSVIRASVMFFFFGVAKVAVLGSNSLNVLFASTFFILLVHPFFLWEPGFQLSFMAVLGILVLYEPVSSLVKSRYWLINKVWSALSVSFVAQLFTAPLIIFYFHQLPVYFLVSNLVVVFLIQFALFLGVIIGVFGEVSLVVWLTEKLVKFINAFIHFISNLPLAKINSLWINESQLVLLYGFIASIILFGLLKRRLFAFVSLITLVGVISISFTRKLNFEKQSYLAFHKARGKLIIEVLKHSQSRFLWFYDSKVISKVVTDFDTYHSFRNVSNFEVINMENVFLVEDNTIGLVRNKSELFYDLNVVVTKYAFSVLTKNGETVFSSHNNKSFYLLND